MDRISSREMKNISMKILKTVGSVIAAMIVLIVAQLVSGIVGGFLPNPSLGYIVSAIIYVMLSLAIGLIYAKHVLHFTPAELGIRKKLPEFKWIVIGIMLPVLISAFYLFCTEGQLIRNDRMTAAFSTIVYAIFTVGIGGGIVEEFIFRGIIMKMMEKYWGKAAAICIPSFLFGISHLANLTSWHLRDAILLAVAGTMVGIMFSMIAYQSKTIWASAVVHGFWNMVIIGGILEIGAVDYGMSIDSIWQYKISGSNMLLTGGQFGIEAAVPAVIGYIVVSFCAFMFGRKSK